MDLSKYYEEICKEPILSSEEESDLFLEYQDEGVSDARKAEIREKIIKANMRFVFRQAKRHSRNDPSAFPALISAGNEGLLIGFEKYDLSLGYKFLSYAGWWVDQQILLEMSHRVVKVPIAKQQLAARIQKALEKDPDLTVAKLKEMFPKARDKDLEEMVQYRYLTYYIEDLDGEPEFCIDPIQEEVDHKLDRERVNSAVAELPSPHRELILELYGFHGDEDKKLHAVAADLGLSKEEAKSIRREAFEMLRSKLGD